MGLRRLLACLLLILSASLARAGTTVNSPIQSANPQAACGDLSNSGTGCTATIGNYAPLASPTFTGTVTMPTVLGAVTTQSGTTYTLAAADCGTLVRTTSASAVTITAPNSLGVGCTIAIEQAGAGQVTVSAGTGATLHSAHSYTKTSAQWAIIGLTVETNSGGTAAVYILTGDGV